MRQRGWKVFLFFLTVILAVSFMVAPIVRAADDDDTNTTGYRYPAWYQTRTQTDAWGGTGIWGMFGPDVGYGEQGMQYQYTNPLTGAYTSYSTSGMGLGAMMPGAFYGGMNSPFALQSYGPYAGGNRPSVQPTLGYDTQGYMSGSLFGPSTQYYQAQPNLMSQMMFGGMGAMLGGFGGFGGFGGIGYGGAAGYGGGYGSGYPSMIGGPSLGVGVGGWGGYPYGGGGWGGGYPYGGGGYYY